MGKQIKRFMLCLMQGRVDEMKKKSDGMTSRMFLNIEYTQTTLPKV